jgi:hypothetical protein
LAKVTKWTLFLRAFFLTLIASSPSRVGSQDAAEQAAWQEAMEQNSAAAYHRYMSLFPAGDFVPDAISALDRLGAINSPSRNVGILGGQRTKDRVY